MRHQKRFAGAPRSSNRLPRYNGLRRYYQRKIVWDIIKDRGKYWYVLILLPKLLWIFVRVCNLKKIKCSCFCLFLIPLFPSDSALLYCRLLSRISVSNCQWNLIFMTCSYHYFESFLSDELFEQIAMDYIETGMPHLGECHKYIVFLAVSLFLNKWKK